MTSPFREADKELAKIFRQIKSEFNRHRLRIMTFDELNVIAIRKETNNLYKKLENINQSYYLKIAKAAYSAACKEVGAVSEDNIDLKWLAVLLANVNTITHYCYNNELERKRERFFESVIAAVYSGSESELIKAYKTAVNYWNRQTEQYEINIIISARIQAFADNGISQVMWNTQKDGHVCGICSDLDGQIFPIDEIPSTHYYCRCFTTPL